MYYALTFAAAICVCVHIACNKRYLRFVSHEDVVSATFKKLVPVTFGSAFIFCCMAGFKLHFSTFAVLMSAAIAAMQLGLSVLAFAAYGNNVSVCTMFQMLGGMMMPFLYGVVFADNKPTVFGSVGIALLSAALVLPCVGNKSKSGIGGKFILLCIGVFLLQGGTNVIMYIHSNSAKGVDTYSFSAMYAAFCAVFSAISLGAYSLVRKRKEGCACEERASKRRLLMTLNIILTVAVSSFSLFFQLIGAAHLPAVALYPILTGGTVALTGIMGRVFFKEKLSALGYAGVAIAFIATVLFVF